MSSSALESAPSAPPAALDLEVVDAVQPMVVALRDNSLDPKSPSAVTVLDGFSPFWNRSKALVAKAQALIDSPTDMATDAKLARTLRLALKDERVSAGKTRVKLKEDALRYGKAVDGVNAVLVLLIKPMEAKLEEIEKAEEIAEQNRKAALKVAREEALRALDVDPTFISVDAMDDAAFNRLVADAKFTREAKIAQAAKLAEEQRLAAEKADADRIEAARVAEVARLAKEEADRVERDRIEAENARLKAEKEAADAAAELARKEREAAEAEAARVLAAERAAAKAEADRLAAIAAEEKRVADEAAAAERKKAEAAKKAAKAEAEAALAEAEAKAKEEARLARAETERIALAAAEEKAKREALEKAESDRLAAIAREMAAEEEAAAIAAAAPDREKLLALVVEFESVELPDMATVAGKMALETVKGHIATLIGNIRFNADAIGGGK